MNRPSIFYEKIAGGISTVIMITGIALCCTGLLVAGVPLLIAGCVIGGIAYIEISCKRR
jgi:hypothetical protein